MLTTIDSYIIDGHEVYYYEESNDVLNEILEDERTFYYMAELDDASDMYNPLSWVKANPNIGVSLDLEIMIEDWEKAKRNPGERSEYITKQYNLFVKSDEQSFIDVSTLKRNNKEVDVKELEGKQCIGGFELSDSEE